MGLFSEDIIEKDLPVEDILKSKIDPIVQGIVEAIDKHSKDGVTYFPRMTKQGTYGTYGNPDLAQGWDDRHLAFMDWFEVALKDFKDRNNETPLRYNGKFVYIDELRCFSNYYTDYRPGDKLKVVIYLTYAINPWTSSSALKFRKDLHYEVFLEPPYRHMHKFHFYEFI